METVPVSSVVSGAWAVIPLMIATVSVGARTGRLPFTGKSEIERGFLPPVPCEN